ncbi:unnamed protein product, partial [Nesidiocoris tenuis]
MNNYVDRHRDKVKLLYEQIRKRTETHKDQVASETNKNREEVPKIPQDVFVKTHQIQNKTKQKYVKEQIESVDPEH